MITGLIANIKLIALTVLSAIIWFLTSKNKKLKQNNKRLAIELKNQTRALTLQKELLNVSDTVKTRDIAGNFERMRKKKL